MKVRAQIGMVLNLDKCIGCHTCSITCKNVWTSRDGVGPGTVSTSQRTTGYTIGGRSRYRLRRVTQPATIDGGKHDVPTVAGIR